MQTVGYAGSQPARFDALTATLDLDPTDCLALADACGHARRFDFPGDASLLRALRAALEACAIIAATDTLRDGNVPERAMLADTRRVWGAHDHATHRDANPRPPRPD